jgi:hypothetical protein
MIEHVCVVFDRFRSFMLRNRNQSAASSGQLAKEPQILRWKLAQVWENGGQEVGR